MLANLRCVGRARPVLARHYWYSRRRGRAPVPDSSSDGPETTLPAPPAVTPASSFLGSMTSLFGLRQDPGTVSGVPVANEDSVEADTTSDSTPQSQREWARRLVDQLPSRLVINHPAEVERLVEAGFDQHSAAEVVDQVCSLVDSHMYQDLLSRVVPTRLAEFDAGYGALALGLRTDTIRRRRDFERGFYHELDIYTKHLMVQRLQGHLMVMDHVSDSQVALTELRLENQLRHEERLEHIHNIKDRILTNVNLSIKSDILQLRWDLIKRGLLFIALTFCVGIWGLREFASIKQEREAEEKKKLMMPTPGLRLHLPTELDEEDDEHYD